MSGLIPVRRYYDRVTYIAILSCGHHRDFSFMVAWEMDAFCLTCNVARYITQVILMIPREAA